MASPLTTYYEDLTLTKAVQIIEDPARRQAAQGLVPIRNGYDQFLMQTFQIF